MGTEYNKNTEGKPDHGMGSPHVPIFVAIIHCLVVEKYKVKEEKVKAAMEHFYKWLTKDETTYEEQAGKVLSCRTKATYTAKGRQAKSRLWYKVQGSIGENEEITLEAALHQYMEAIEGGEQKHGEAPRSGLERKLSHALSRTKKT